MRRSLPDTYADKLILEGIITTEQISKIEANHIEHLTNEYNNVDSYEPDAYYFKNQWSGIQQATNSITYWDTGLDYSILKYIGEKSVDYPKDFVRFLCYFYVSYNFFFGLPFVRIFIHIY